MISGGWSLVIVIMGNRFGLKIFKKFILKFNNAQGCYVMRFSMPSKQKH